MTAADIAVLMKDYGSVGLNGLLIAALIKVYKDKEALSTGFLERLVKGLESATDAAKSTEKALEELRRLIDASGKTVGEHSHQIAILVEKIVHGFGNTSASLEGVAGRLERFNGQVEELRRRLEGITSRDGRGDRGRS